MKSTSKSKASCEALKQGEQAMNRAEARALAKEIEATTPLQATAEQRLSAVFAKAIGSKEPVQWYVAAGILPADDSPTGHVWAIHSREEWDELRPTLGIGDGQ